MAKGGGLKSVKYYICEPFDEVLGTEGPIPRTEAISRVWDYIKTHDLQNPKNKRMIVPDELMAECFGNKQFSMFKLAGMIGEFLEKVE